MCCDSRAGNNWSKIKTIGTKSNRSGIGARIKCVTHLPGEKSLHPQIDEVRSGGGYFSQNDLRVRFGIGKAENVELLEIRWPSGLVETLKDIKPNPVIFVKEGESIVRTMQFDAPKFPKPSNQIPAAEPGSLGDLCVFSARSALIFFRSFSFNSATSGYPAFWFCVTIYFLSGERSMKTKLIPVMLLLAISLAFPAQPHDLPFARC